MMRLPTERRPRRGFTLPEILVALTILSIIGAAMVRLIIVQSRFSEQQMALRNARTVSRNAMNIMLTDLRMVQDNGGLVAASNDSVTVREPIAFGLYCSPTSGAVLSLLPVDSSMMAMARYGGWAYRDSATGRYVYKDAGSATAFNSLPSAASTVCTDSLTGPGILNITYGTRATKVIQLTDSPSGSPSPGWPAFVYQYVTYKFKASSTFPGRIGLWRKVNNGSLVNDEIIAPFDASAKFRFYVLNEDTAQTAVPADINTVRGLQLVLAGASPRVPQGGSQAKQATLVTGVFFKNRRDP